MSRELDGEMFRSTTQPPAHLLQMVWGSCCLAEMPPNNKVQVVFIAEVQHVETRQRWYQAFTLSRRMARKLGADLMAHGSHVQEDKYEADGM